MDTISSQTMLRMGLFQCGSNKPKHFDRIRHFDWKSGRLIVIWDLWICTSSIGTTAIYLVWEQQMKNKTSWKLFLILPKLSDDDKSRSSCPVFCALADGLRGPSTCYCETLIFVNASRSQIVPCYLNNTVITTVHYRVSHACLCVFDQTHW